MSHQEAADQLGWPLGTVKARVARGRDRLRGRLIRRGVTLSTSALASTLLGESVASAVVPPTLLLASTRAALAFAAGRVLAVTLVSPPVFHLTQGAARAMILTKFKVFALALAAGTTVLAVPGVVAYQARVQTTDALRPAPSKPDQSPTKADQIIKNDVGNVPAVPAPGTFGKPLIKNDVGNVSALPAPGSFGKPPGDEPALSNQSPQELLPSPQDEAKNLAILKKLEEPSSFPKTLIVVSNNGFTPPLFLAAMQQFLKEATVDPKAGLPQGITSTFASPVAQQIAQTKRINTTGLDAYTETTPLRVVLSNVSRSMGLDYQVSGGALQFDLAPDLLNLSQYAASPERANINKRRLDDEKRNETIRAKLDKVVSMKFPNKVSLNDLLAFVKQATKEPDEKPIPIYVDPSPPRKFSGEPGPEAKAVDANEPIFLVDLEDVPLRTSLRLALDQMDLVYQVSGGLLIIGDSNNIVRLLQSPNGGGMSGMGGGMGFGMGAGGMGGGGMGGGFR